MHTLPNYDPRATHRILYLDFDVTRAGPGKPEQAVLTNVILGNGQLKNISRGAHNPYQINVVRYFSDKRLPQRDSLAHPLFKSLEVADRDGTLSRRLTSDLTGHVSLRFAYPEALTKIELYSSTPDGGTTKLYTLRLKL
jgi:hypothetical protein